MRIGSGGSDALLSCGFPGQETLFRLRGEKVVAAVPVLNAALADRAQVRLVDQGRGLECLPERAG